MNALIISVALSLGLMAFVLSTYRREGFSTAMVLLLASVSGCIGFLLPALFLHTILIVPGLFIWKWRRWPASTLVAYMLLAAVGAYSFFVVNAWQQVAEYRRLREVYAFESMENRLPAPKKQTSAKLSKDSQHHLAELAQSMQAEANDFPGRTH
jgi:hypothetical protein